MKKPNFATACCLVLGALVLAPASLNAVAAAQLALGETSSDHTSLASKASGSQTQPSTPNSGCTKLAGKNGEAAEWGSGWIDLELLATFESGTRLKITVGGSAKKILVRLLKDGQSAEQPNGVLGKYDVPSGRVLEVPIAAKKSGITQISVHGSPRAWTYSLGASNGPATIEDIEYCK